MDSNEIKDTLKTWMKWCRTEQIMISTMTFSYMPDKDSSYREGYLAALQAAESRIGLSMFIVGIDLRDVAAPLSMAGERLEVGDPVVARKGRIYKAYSQPREEELK